MTLRDDLIEAGAEAIERRHGDPRSHTFEDLAEVVIDAVLDVLADRADEWWHLSFVPEYRKARVTDNLIAVLRGDTE